MQDYEYFGHFSVQNFVGGAKFSSVEALQSGCGSIAGTVVTAKRQELVVCSRLAHTALFDEVTREKEICSEYSPLNRRAAAYMQSAFCIVDKRCAIAMVVRPRAALSRASWTTFSELESKADVACKYNDKHTISGSKSENVLHPREGSWDYEAKHGR